MQTRFAGQANGRGTVWLWALRELEAIYTTASTKLVKSDAYETYDATHIAHGGC